ncbi:MAG TPA: FG-GAP repeat protein [Solirubrobacteraceae bacterium]|nr:FG-GAP repeat protein [Solirubrobacteraceae bacterium]
MSQTPAVELSTTSPAQTWKRAPARSGAPTGQPGELRKGWRWLALSALLALMIARWATPIGDSHPRTAAHQPVHAGALTSLPLLATEAVSRSLGADQSKYWAAQDHGRIEMLSTERALAVRFLSSGPLMSAGHARLQLRLHAVGRGKRLRRLPATAPTAKRNRVSYTHDGKLLEWYVNGPLGLEQGFTLRTPPQRQLRGGPLTLSVGLLAAGLLPKLDSGRHSLTLTRADGTSAFRYHGLRVTDARGQELHSWLELGHNELLIKANDATARYPLRVDPIIETAKLTSTDSSPLDRFGVSVAAAGDTIVVCSPGTAYVFTKPVSGWATVTQTAKLTTTSNPPNARFGASVAVSNDTIVVGAPNDIQFDPHAGPGVAYVFVKPDGGWTSTTETAKLTATDATAGNLLGTSVAIAGDTIVAGAPGAADNQSYQGAAYVFVKPPSGWTNATATAKLTATDGATGASVAISGDTIVAGAPGATVNNQSYEGAAYAFVKPASGWTNTTATTKLTATDATAGSLLGTSIAIAGDTIVAGAPSDTVNGQSRGAAYVFVQSHSDPANITEAAKLTASDAQPNIDLGITVGISANTIITGTYASAYAALVFVKPASGWSSATETVRLTTTDPSYYNHANSTVALSGSTIAYGDPNNVSFYGRGTASVFLISPLTTTGNAAASVETASLTASVNPQGVAALSDCHFDYGTTSAYGNQAQCLGQVGAGDSPVTVSAQLGNLTAGTTYHYRIAATSEVDTSYGADATFTTYRPPTAGTAGASDVTQTTVTLAGSTNPQGLPESGCYFDYGPTDGYGAQAPCAQQPGAGASPVAVSAQLAALRPGTTYHYRLVATNVAGSAYGDDQTFTTQLPPATSTVGASAITVTAATVSGSVNPNGLRVLDCHFDYGPANTYGSRVPCTPQPGSGSSPVAVSARLTGLAAGTTYHYRLTAITPAGTSTGADARFTTVAPPPPPPRMTATMQWAFSLNGSYTSVTTLNVHGAPAQAKVSVTCHGHGCPFTKHLAAAAAKRCKTGHCQAKPHTATINLAASFHGHRLAPHVQITVAITKRGWVGKYYSFTILNHHTPRIHIACLPPGTTKPRAIC